MSAASQIGFTDMPWAFDDVQADWRASVRAYAENELRPGATERSLAAATPDEIFDGLGKLGVFGLRVSRENGGAGAGLTDLCIALEELARVDSSAAATAHTQSVVCALLEAMASEEQKAAVLPGAISGETVLCFAITEPSGGSDAGDIATRARRDGGDWVLNGAKQFITNPGTPRSKYALLFANTGDGSGGRRQVSGFLVPLDAPGVTVAPKYDKLGWRASDTHPVFLDDVRLPASAMLGSEHRGLHDAMAFLVWSRLPIAAVSTGLAQACLEETLDFVADRRSFGKGLAEHQVVAFDIAGLAADVAAARVLTYDGCYKVDHGLPYLQEAAVAKFMASEIANKVAYRATQLHGGYGFMDDSAVTRHYRDARILTIGEGTSEVQQMLIARSVGLDV
jgi:short-chain 2-methylacyl-CoA dehydrogenase